MGNKHTIKMYKLICLLPKHKGSIRAAAKEAGYAPSVYNSGRIYHLLKKQTLNPVCAELFKPDTVKQSILDAEEHFLKGVNKGDNFCYMKALEMRAKVSGVLEEKKQVNNFLFGNIQTLQEDLPILLPKKQIEDKSNNGNSPD